MKTYTSLYTKICSRENIFSAYEKARKHKTSKDYVKEFEENLSANLQKIQEELETKTYVPLPLETFIVRDPKTRKISKSAFKDRVVHHAIHNIIQPILDKRFIHDSYANRKNKGTLAAIKRYEEFQRKVTQNYTIKNQRLIKSYVLKADVKKFFDSVNHQILINILERKIKDEDTINLIKKILDNHQTTEPGRGMPLGNLTSQFFANVYLNELDQYVKHELKAKYYIRYVDDFVIMHKSKEQLEKYVEKINIFLRLNLALKLHPDKTKITPLHRGVKFLGIRVFSHHRLLAEKTIRRFHKKFPDLIKQYDEKTITQEKMYDFIQGWTAYSKNANTHNLRSRLLEPHYLKMARELSDREFKRCKVKRFKQQKNQK
ncbi:MAG: reverse transcriptase domain-containing protein [Candidatus Nanoarchaeia archaeon]